MFTVLSPRPTAGPGSRPPAAAPRGVRPPVDSPAAPRSGSSRRSAPPQHAPGRGELPSRIPMIPYMWSVRALSDARMPGCVRFRGARARSGRPPSRPVLEPACEAPYPLLQRDARRVSEDLAGRARVGPGARYVSRLGRQHFDARRGPELRIEETDLIET